MNVLSISEYHELVKMLRSSKDDREIVIENLTEQRPLPIPFLSCGSPEF